MESSAVSSSSNGWIGISIVSIAGLAVILGGLSIFAVKKQLQPLTLSFCMGLSSGVMIYVAFLDMLPEGIEHFQDYLTDTYGDDDNTYANAYIIGTSSLFLGWLLAAALNHAFEYLIAHSGLLKTIRNTDFQVWQPNEGCSKVCCIDDNIKQRARMTYNSDDSSVSSQLEAVEEPVDSIEDPEATREKLQSAKKSCLRRMWESHSATKKEDVNIVKAAEEAFKNDQEEFLKLGLFTGLVLGLHNFTLHGMGTFFAYMSDPSFGYGMAIAITIHNLPEGLSIAVPLYFGTGSYVKAMTLCVIAAVAEPIGGLFAWLIISKFDINPIVFGFLFTLQAGILINVAITKMLVGSMRYDPTDIITTISFSIGCVVMGSSLCGFKYTGGG